MTIEADRNLISVINSRIKHGGASTVLSGDARWAYTDAVQRVLEDHAVLRAAHDLTDNGEIVMAACDAIWQIDSNRRGWDYTHAISRLRRAVKKLKET